MSSSSFHNKLASIQVEMEAFVLKTLRKIRKEAPRRFKELRDVCDELISRTYTSTTFLEVGLLTFPYVLRQLHCQTRKLQTVVTHKKPMRISILNS